MHNHQIARRQSTNMSPLAPSNTMRFHPSHIRARQIACINKVVVIYSLAPWHMFLARPKCPHLCPPRIVCTSQVLSLHHHLHSLQKLPSLPDSDFSRILSSFFPFRFYYRHSPVFTRNTDKSQGIIQVLTKTVIGCLAVRPRRHRGRHGHRIMRAT